MQFEKSRRGLLREAFCSEGECAKCCKRWGKGGVSVLENEVNIEGLSANKNECSVASFVRIRRKKLTKLATFLFTESPSMSTTICNTGYNYF